MIKLIHNDIPIIFLMGPTASGKTNLSLNLYNFLPIDIISVDSGLIYKKMNIGTAKPSSDILNKIPHKLINILNPTQSYSAAQFRIDVLKEIKLSLKKNRIPFLVGGSMFYFKILLHGLQNTSIPNKIFRENIHNAAKIIGWPIIYQYLKYLNNKLSSNSLNIHPNDSYRILRKLEILLFSNNELNKNKNLLHNTFPYTKIYQFALTTSNRNFLNQKIEYRFQNMLNHGFEKEVYNLISTEKISKNMQSMKCIGYLPLWLYIEKKISYKEMISKSLFLTRNLAKNQLTWLRSWKNLNLLNIEKPVSTLTNDIINIIYLKENKILKYL